MESTLTPFPKHPLKPLIIPVFIPHCGCPHACVFCNQQAITGASQAIPEKKEIHARVDEFLNFKRKNRLRTELSFFGGNFLGLEPARIRQLLDAGGELAAAGKIDGIRFSTRPDTIDENTLRLIRDYPVSTVELGAQSMDNQVLQQAGRGHSAEDTAAAVTLLRKENIIVGLQIMTGLPGDTEAICLETALRIIALKPDFVRIYPTLVLHGCRLAEWYQSGRYQPLSLDACVTQLKKLYLLFTAKGIPVIRMGLQASEELDNPATVLAGPYHPALGHMVFSEILMDAAVRQIREKSSHGDGVCLWVNPRSLSRMQGLNKKNIQTIKQMFGLTRVEINTDKTLALDAVTVRQFFSKTDISAWKTGITI